MAAACPIPSVGSGLSHQPPCDHSHPSGCFSAFAWPATPPARALSSAINAQQVFLDGVTGAQDTSKHQSSVQWWLWPLLVAVSSKGRWCDLLGFIALSRVKTAEEPTPTKTMWVNCHQRNSTGTCRWRGLIIIPNLFFQGCGHTRFPLL